LNKKENQVVFKINIENIENCDGGENTDIYLNKYNEKKTKDPHP